MDRDMVEATVTILEDEKNDVVVQAHAEAKDKKFDKYFKFPI